MPASPHDEPPTWLSLDRGRRDTARKALLARQLRRKMTQQEIILWARLRGRRLAGLGFRRQHVIEGFVVDFYCHAARVVVEVDGPVHDQQLDYDAERDAILTACDLLVLRVGNANVQHDLEDVLGRIRDACLTRLSPTTILPSPEGVPTQGRQRATRVPRRA